VTSQSEGNTLFLDAASAYGFEPLSQAFRIHSRGGANRLKILVVVKQELLGFAAKTQRPTDPFFQCFGDNGAPESFFSRSLIINLQHRTFEHEVCPRANLFWLNGLTSAVEGPELRQIQREAGG
jgi:hypothetical protein